jgi:hypothetical protein
MAVRKQEINFFCGIMMAEIFVFAQECREVWSATSAFLLP